MPTKTSPSSPLVPVLGAGLALGLFVLAPVFREWMPATPWLPGAISGIVFCGFWAASSSSSTTTTTTTATSCLSKSDWTRFKLVQKTQISSNTAIYKFALPHPEACLGLPIGQHISLGAEINGKDIQRSYTPISSDDDKGFFELLIKTYPTGNISRHVDELKIGDDLRVKGPKGFFTYSSNMCKQIGMIAGGTGITPMLQIIKAILKNPEDKTKVSLIFANVNVDDILLKKELDELASTNKDRFKVYYVLNNPPKDWQGGVGFVTKEMMITHLPKFQDAASTKLLLCGPPPMIKAMTGYAEEGGWPKANAISKLPDAIFKF